VLKVSSFGVVSVVVRNGKSDIFSRIIQLPFYSITEEQMLTLFD